MSRKRLEYGVLFGREVLVDLELVKKRGIKKDLKRIRGKIKKR